MRVSPKNYFEPGPRVSGRREEAESIYECWMGYPVAPQDRKRTRRRGGRPEGMGPEGEKEMPVGFPKTDRRVNGGDGRWIWQTGDRDLGLGRRRWRNPPDPAMLN